MSHLVWQLEKNTSARYEVLFGSTDPGIVLIEPAPEHGGEHGHEHHVMYIDPSVGIRDGNWYYQVTVRNLKNETAHFRIRWATGL